jgi:hypothetical protein
MQVTLKWGIILLKEKIATGLLGWRLKKHASTKIIVQEISKENREFPTR